MEDTGTGWTNLVALAVLVSLLIVIAPSVSQAVAAPTSAIANPSGATQVVGPSAVGSMAGNLVCTPVIPACPCGTVPTESGCLGPAPNMFMCGCKDLTFGFETPGICVANNICLGLGTVSITGAAIGIGKGIVGKLFGGESSSNSGIGASMSLAGGSKVGCSGTPYITLTPSTDSCAVYIPTGATSTTGVNLGSLSPSPSVSSVLFSSANNGSGAAGASSGVSNTPLSFFGATGGSASQTGVSSQLLSNTTSGGANSPANSVSGSLLGGGLSTGGAYSLGANSSFNSGVSGATGLSSFLSNIGNTLINALSGETNGSPSANSGTGLLNMISGDTNAPATGVSSLLGNYGADTGNLSNASANVPNIPPKLSGVQSGTWGDIQANASGATIIVGGHGADGRTGIAGFYGYDAVTDVTPQNLAKQMCAARPWGNLAATSIIQPSFFDSICVARGYKEVAVLPEMNNASAAAGNANKNTSSVATSGTSNATKKVITTTEPSLPAGPVYVAPPTSVLISAVPARVRIGARSTIYWNAKGVTSCAVSSPDGSFTENTLNGAASTVALYDNTEFTIVCWTQDGTSVSKSVTVETSS